MGARLPWLPGAFGFTLAEANCQHRWVKQQNRSGQAMESCNAVKMRPTQVKPVTTGHQEDKESCVPLGFWPVWCWG